MEQTAGVDKLLRSWSKIPRQIEKSVHGLSNNEIRSRKGDNFMSIHEMAHRVAEASNVAASMIIASIGKDGGTYDWTWLYPNMDWVERLGYAKTPIKPAMKMLVAMNEHIANLVRVNPKFLKRKVTLFETRGGKKYTMTDEEIMYHEVSHAIQHLKEVAAS